MSSNTRNSLGVAEQVLVCATYLNPIQPFHRTKAFKEAPVRKHGPSALAKLGVHATYAGSALLKVPKNNPELLSIVNVPSQPHSHHAPRPQRHGVSQRVGNSFFGTAWYCAAVVDFFFFGEGRSILRCGRVFQLSFSSPWQNTWNWTCRATTRTTRVRSWRRPILIPLSSSAKRRPNEGNAGCDTEPDISASRDTSALLQGFRAALC